MASRKEQKEQARAQRLAQEQAAVAQKQRTRRLQIFGGLIAVAVVVVVVVVATSLGGSGTPGLQHGKSATAVYNTVNNELKGIPEHGTTLGDPSAKVTLTYFGDLQCPICADFTRGVNGGGLPEFISKDVRTGIAKVTYKSFCTATCNDYSNGQTIFTDQQSEAYAAGRQGLFWYFAELFYHQQGTEGSGYATPAFRNQIAEQIPNLNLKQWQQDSQSSALRTQVSTDMNEAIDKYKFNGTPAFVVSGPKGTTSLGSGNYPYSELEQGVKAVS